MLSHVTQSLSSPAAEHHYSHTLNPVTASMHLQTYQHHQLLTDTVDATPNFTPPKKKNLLDRLFGFLSDGTTSAPAVSTALGKPTSTSLFRQRKPTGGLLSRSTSATNEYTQPQQTGSEQRQSSQSHPKSPSHLLPPWSTWKNWKKMTIDFYIRLLDTPQYSRLRLKQTIAPLPIIKLKPVIDLAYRGPGKSPLTMHLDVKLLDCLKYRVHTDGSSHLQVRARAPMSDPRFTMDVIYERQLGTALDSVKITFRALNVAFLKAPSPGFGCKIPIRFNNGIKSTIRVKKFIDQRSATVTSTGKGSMYSRKRHHVTPKTRKPHQGTKGRHPLSGTNSSRVGHDADANQLGIFGPVGVDVKLRCLEYR